MTQIQQASARLRVNGVVCDACLSISIEQTNYAQAGTFRARLLLDQGAGSAVVWAALMLATPDRSPEILVDIEIGTTATDQGSTSWRSMIVGRVDHVAMDVESGLVELEGRDLLARLMDLPSTTSFVNQTSSQIVAALTAEAGLTPNVQPTSAIVGQFYEIEHSRASLDAFSRFSTAFDIISYLAHAEGFDCWMDGQILNFQPSDIAGTIALVIDLSQLGPNTQAATSLRRLKLERRVGLDNGVQVTVRSWNSRQRVAVTGSSPAASDSAGFTFVAPNLTDQAASARAQALCADIARHRRSVSGEMTGDVALMPRSLIQIVGTNGWDGVYVIDVITRDVSSEGGFSQSFVARSQ